MWELEETVVDDFYSNVKIGRDCWEWNGVLNKQNYGRFWTGTKNIFAHRLSYFIHFGDIGNKFVCHKCDNPKCVKPSHLFLGTHKDNMRDMSKKGRNNTKRKTITDGIKLRVLQFIKQGKDKARIAELLGISLTTVNRINVSYDWRSKSYDMLHKLI